MAGIAMKFSFFHIVLCGGGNYGNLFSLFIGKNFVKVTILLDKLQKSWFDEIFFCESKFFILPHCDLYGLIYLVKKDLTVNVKVDAFCTKVFEIEFSAKVGNIFHLICSFPVAHHALSREKPWKADVFSFRFSLLSSETEATTTIYLLTFQTNM